MKSEIVAFPWGTPQGFPVQRIDFEGEPFDVEKAEMERDRHAGAHGIWATWLDGIESWESPELSAWLNTDVICVRPLGADDWPAGECNTILDVSIMREHLTSIEALAHHVSQHVAANPVVEDVILVLGLDDRPPMTAALDLLDDFVGARGINYLYAPADHPNWPLLLRSVSQASGGWALRRLP